MGKIISSLYPTGQRLSRHFLKENNFCKQQSASLVSKKVWDDTFRVKNALSMGAILEGNKLIRGSKLLPFRVAPDEQEIKSLTLIWVFRPFQEYFIYIEPIVQRWAKTGEPGKKKQKKKHLTIRKQNLAFP